MRAMTITLRTRRPATLPLANNELLQGLLYSCWRDAFPEVHDRGFGTSRPLRLFTFGPLTGSCSADGRAKTIRLDGAVRFEVRSPLEVLLDELARQLSSHGKARIGAHELDLVNMQACDRLVFPPRAVLRMASPVVAYRTLEDGHTEHYSPNDPEWLPLVSGNAAHKAETLSLEAAVPLVVIPRSETLRKRVTRFKGTYITGWTGDLIASCDPAVLSLLYYTGLGAKGSQGFGMFDILDERP